MEYLAYCVEKAVAAEREKCIEVLLSNFDIEDEDVFNVAAAIRARGNPGIKWEVEP
jgi:hypothetical protein